MIQQSLPFDPPGKGGSLAVGHIGPSASPSPFPSLSSLTVFPGLIVRPKFSLGSREKKIKETKRGLISGFSRKSRNRLLRLSSSLDFKYGHVFFCSLTFPLEFPHFWISKNMLRALFKRIQRQFGKFGCIWRIEPQKRMAPHFHLILFLGRSVPRPSLQRFLSRSWYKIVGSNDQNHLKFGSRCDLLVSSRGSVAYVSKYLSKTSSTVQWGRQWGRVGDLPFASVTFSLFEKDLYRIWRCFRRIHRLSGKFFYGSFFVRNLPETLRLLRAYGVPESHITHNLW